MKGGNRVANKSTGNKGATKKEEVFGEGVLSLKGYTLFYCIFLI